jgi:hypothetical protein
VPVEAKPIFRPDVSRLPSSGSNCPNTLPNCARSSKNGPRSSPPGRISGTFSRGGERGKMTKPQPFARLSDGCFPKGLGGGQRASSTSFTDGKGPAGGQRASSASFTGRESLGHGKRLSSASSHASR